MTHVVLLGDSIFDNGAYVGSGPDVIAQVRGRLPAGAKATLRAVDGAVLANVPGQLRNLPADASHLVVSAGGNDALGAAGILGLRLGSMVEALEQLAAVRARFERDYRAMLRALIGTGLPTAVCTIYDPNYPEAERQRLSITALSALNDIVLRTAFEHGLSVIDLRLVCNNPADYANPIEPSSAGGEKIAAAIVDLVAGAAPGRRRSAVLS